jgi:DNA mismatch endonuclease (patch repair protein)
MLSRAFDVAGIQINFCIETNFGCFLLKCHPDMGALLPFAKFPAENAPEVTKQRLRSGALSEGGASMDVFSPEDRSKIMARIGPRNTKPELRVRKLAHNLGYRFRLHRKDLPGTPDLVFPRYRVVVFVHGCFWHRHQGCRYATTPATRQEFWEAKFEGNVARDRRAIESLEGMGWKVLVIWECETRDVLKTGERLQAFLKP